MHQPYTMVVHTPARSAACLIVSFIGPCFLLI